MHLCNTAASHVTAHSPSRSVVKHLVKFADSCKCQWKCSTKTINCPIQYLDPMVITLQHCNIWAASAEFAWRQKILLFSASVEHVKIVGIMVQCEECDMWCFLYSEKKLQLADRQALERSLENITYTCGAQLQDLELVATLATFCGRNIRCNNPIKNCIILWGPIPLYVSTVHVRVVWLARTGATHSARIAITLARRPSRRASRKEVNNVHVCICVSWAF